MENEREKPIVELLGSDGNSMMIIGKCRLALKKEATSSDYDHLIQTAMKWCEVE